MRPIRSFVFSAVLGIASLNAASSLPMAQPVEVGLSEERLGRIVSFVERLQSEGRVAGAITVVARRGKVAQFEVRGLADIEGKRAMRADDIFAIASMTKPIATVGVLMLLEEQKLLLSDPLEKFLRE